MSWELKIITVQDWSKAANHLGKSHSFFLYCIFKKIQPVKTFTTVNRSDFGGISGLVEYQGIGIYFMS